MDRRTDGPTTSVKQVWRERTFSWLLQGCLGHNPACPDPTEPSRGTRRGGRGGSWWRKRHRPHSRSRESCRLRGSWGGEILGKENISSSESRPHSSTLEEVLFLGHPPNLCHHRTLGMRRFGAGRLALLTPATFDGRQNQPDCNASQKYIHFYGVGGKSPHWCLVPAGLHPLGKGCKGVCAGCCRQRRGRVGAVQAGFSRGGIAQA